MDEEAEAEAIAVDVTGDVEVQDEMDADTLPGVPPARRLETLRSAFSMLHECRLCPRRGRLPLWQLLEATDKIRLRAPHDYVTGNCLSIEVSMVLW